MATPEVKVRIAADDQFSKATKGIADGVKALGAAIVGTAIGGFFRAATDAAVEFEKSQSKLEATSKLTGVALGELKQVAERGMQEFRLSAPVANDFATELAKLAQKAGDVGKASPGMAAFLDLGAARGLSASETLKAVQQAILGIDEGTDKLFGKNPSVLYQEYASQIGTTAGKLSDQEKAQAILNAALSDGLKVQGEYGRFLGTLGGGIALVSQRWDEFKLAIGQAMNSSGDTQGALGLVSQALADMAGWVKDNEGLIADLSGSLVLFGQQMGETVAAVAEFPGVGFALTQSVKLIGAGLLVLGTTVKRTGGAFYDLAGTALEAIGMLVKTGGRMLKIFGIEVVAETGAAMEETGRTWRRKGEAIQEEARVSFMNGMDRLYGSRKEHNNKITLIEVDHNEKSYKREKDHQDKVTAVHEEGGNKRLTKAQEKAELMKLYMERANEIFVTVTKQLEQGTVPQLRDMHATLEEINGGAIRAATSIKLSKDQTEFLAEAGKLVADRYKKFADDVDRAKQKMHEQVDKARSLGESFLGLAESAGVLDSRAASTLRSVIQMGTDLAKFGFTSPQGVLAVINGLSQLIGGWGSSPAEQARKEAHLKNTRALEELSKDFGDYTGSTSGRTFSGVTSALDDALAGVDPKSINAKNIGSFVKSIEANLAKQGVSAEDLKALATRYGIELGSPESFFALLTILKGKKFGAASSFTDQLASLEDSFGALGIEDADDQLQQFGDLLDKNVPALKGALGDTSTRGGRDAAIARLKALYTASITGKLAPAEYGKASPPQFRQIVSTLLRLLGSADGFLANAQAVTPPTAAPTDTGPIPGGGASTSGLVTGGLTPTVGVAGATLDGFELSGGATIGTMNNNITLNVQSHPDESAAEYAERVATIVADRLGTRYLRQQSALGIV